MTTTTPTLVEPSSVLAACCARVLFFGRIADVCGRSLAVSIPSRGCSLDDLKRLVAEQVDGAAAALGQPGVRVAIDQAMTRGEAWVSPGQEVAFLPAFSGG